MTATTNTSGSGIRARWRAVTTRAVAELDTDARGEAGDARTEPSLEQLPAQAQLRACAEVLDVSYTDNLRGQRVSAAFVERFPIRFARQHGVVAFCTQDADASNGPLTVAISSPDSWPALDMVRRHMRRDVRPLFVPEDCILTAINAAYQQRDGQANNAVSLLDADADTDVTTLAMQEDLLDGVDKPPMIRLVNSVLYEAIQARASDVHIQPQEDDVVVRQRIDGVLFDTLRIPKMHQEEVTSRLKILGRMNIAEKRLPQDGRATVEFGDRLVDLRIATLPTSYGERVVIRFLDKNVQLYTLPELGMLQQNCDNLRRLIRRDHGILLVTGPTGSGKSTTLYAALQEINAKGLNVLTLEDPIEYQLEGISQTQINQKKGLTFAKGLRHVLRQDPDIIMVGEIRDQETAEMAIQSALTGHLVFSTLHTNDAASALTRLLDLGIEPYLTASSVIAVLAQRLVRKLCSRCKRPVGGGDSTGDGSARRHEAVGCPECRRTGYQGRVGIFELLKVSDAIRDLVQSHANAQAIRAQATAEGMMLLYDDGMRKVREGITSIDEVVRVTTFE